MTTFALLAYLLYLALAFGLRTAIQIRHTGSSGFKGISGRAGSAEWLAGVLFALALVVGLAAPVLALADIAEPLGRLDGNAAHAVGAVLFVLGLAATLAAQFAMGTAWRIGVDHSERTELVTSGPFGYSRNPIFASMIPASLGLALMVPSLVAIAGALALLLAVQLQVRVVEEPYLTAVHGPSYAQYAARVGRFVPWLGRM